MNEYHFPRSSRHRPSVDRPRILWSYDGMVRALARGQQRQLCEPVGPSVRELGAYLEWAELKYDWEGAAEPRAQRIFSRKMDVSVLPADLVLRFSPPSWGLCKDQLFALTRSLLPLSLVEGAQGSGRPTTLGAIAVMHAAMGHQVFVLAPTNEAADEVSLHTDELVTGLFKSRLRGAVVRAGTPVYPGLAGQEYLFEWARVLQDHVGTINRLQEDLTWLERERDAAAESRQAALTARLAEKHLALGWARRRRAVDLEAVLARARIIITTVHDAFLEPTLRELICNAPGAGSIPAPSPSEACRALVRWLADRNELERLASDDDLPGDSGFAVGQEVSRRRTMIFDGAPMVPRYAAMPLLDVQVDHVVVAGDARRPDPPDPENFSYDFNDRYWLVDNLFDAAGFHDGEVCRTTLAERGTLTRLDESNWFHGLKIQGFGHHILWEARS